MNNLLLRGDVSWSFIICIGLVVLDCHILHGNMFFPNFPAKTASKWAFYGKMGDEKSHHNVLGRGFLPLHDSIDRNFTVISGLAAHICRFST